LFKIQRQAFTLPSFAIAIAITITITITITSLIYLLEFEDYLQQ
jgi:hypothetical protein